VTKTRLSTHRTFIDASVSNVSVVSVSIQTDSESPPIADTATPSPSPSPTIPDSIIDAIQSPSLITSAASRLRCTEMFVSRADDIRKQGFTIIKPNDFVLMPSFLKSSSSSVSVIQRDFIAIADYMFKQSFIDKHIDLSPIQAIRNKIDDTQAPMIDLAALRKLTNSELEAAELDKPPLPYDHLWQFIDHVFNTVTTSVGREVFGSRKLKMMENVKLLVCDHNTPAQRPHIDATAPTIDTFIYFDTHDADVDCTVFYQTVNENGAFGEIEELILHHHRWDHRYALPWTDTDKHPIVSPSKVPNGTIVLASGGVIHHGPKSTTKGKRYVLYFSSTVPAVNVGADESASNTNEVTYAYVRFKDEEDNHHFIAEACRRFGSDWKTKVAEDAVTEIDIILNKMTDRQ
jgi:hypothetical protein